MLFFIQLDKTISNQPLEGVQGWLIEDGELIAKINGLMPFFAFRVSPAGDLLDVEDDQEGRQVWEQKQTELAAMETTES